MTLRMSLLPRTLLPWTLCNQTTQCPVEKVNHLTNTVRNLTLASTLLNYKNSSSNLRTNLPTWSLPPTYVVELTQLTDRLQHLTMILKPHPTPQAKEEPVHTTMQVYTDTLHTTQRKANLTMSLLQDIPHIQWTRLLKFKGQAHRPRNCH